ncbi:MAG: 30S ribosome-binding factor RbfA [Gammaproteobacteria bacterium]|nr:30S ribosome-binding factor RbfA [Gammaproteobacteria bacterium]
MPREFPRARRIEEQLLRLLPELIRREIRDPRVGPLTITAVEVARDLSHARVYVTPFAGAGDAVAIVAALRSAAGFLRHAVRNQMGLKVAPELDFRVDESIEQGARLTALIDEAVAGDRRRTAAADPAEE